jgi:bifunctional polynucleotide phosphatase/kinase
LTVQLLKDGKSVIVDNTNRDVMTRVSYIQAAKAKNCRIRAILMKCESKQAQHNNAFREIMGTDDKHKGISSMVFRMFFSALQEPTRDEGFDDIIHCNFVPDFADEKTRQAYSLILNEK